MKVFLASLATGVLVVGLMITGFLIAKLLFPGSPNGRLALMIFCWPILFTHVSTWTTESLVLAFFAGTVLDVVVVSFVSFLIFRARQSRRARLRPAVPPPPPSF